MWRAVVDLDLEPSLVPVRGPSPEAKSHHLDRRHLRDEERRAAVVVVVWSPPPKSGSIYLDSPLGLLVVVSFAFEHECRVGRWQADVRSRG